MNRLLVLCIGLFFLLCLILSACQSGDITTKSARVEGVILRTTIPEEVTPELLALSETAVFASTPTGTVGTSFAQLLPSGSKSTNTPSPQPSPSPSLPPTPTQTPEPVWLSYLNQFRLLAGLPLLKEDDVLTVGSEAHSEYMAVLDNPDARYQSKRTYPEYYSEAGDSAARNSNIFSTMSQQGEYDWAINYWMSAPFNIVPILDPQLESVGFGYYEDGIGEVTITAVLDVNSAIDETVAPNYPITYPQDGGKTWITAYYQYEYPNPLTVCEGYQQPTGPPLVLQIGSGAQIPKVSAFQFKRGDQLLSACLLDETNYVSEDAYAQEFGRAILDARDAIVIIPKRPLSIGNRYTAAVEVNGEWIEWSFTTVPRPEATLAINPQYEPPADIQFMWPVSNHDVYKSFWYKHTGIDLLLPVGAPVVASEDGTVFARGWDERGYGNTIQLSHGDGIRTLYGHLESFNVRLGDEVKQGDVIGFVGNTGNSDQPHLHFEIMFHYYRPVDPCDYLVDVPPDLPEAPLAEEDYLLIDQSCGQKMLLVERP